jgi:hypothetical protein
MHMAPCHAPFPATPPNCRRRCALLQTFSEAQTRVTTSAGDVLEGCVAVVLCQALGMSGISNFISPDRSMWTSAKGARPWGGGEGEARVRG